MTTRNLTSYTEEFKLQMVKLYENGKSSKELTKEYGMSSSTLHSWLKRYNNSGSFKKEDNMTELEKELIVLRKQNKQLLMENDILKQAALIMARK